MGHWAFFPAVTGFWFGILFLLVLAITLHNIPKKYGGRRGAGGLESPMVKAPFTGKAKTAFT